MPLYQYQCTECGVRFERHQHYDEAPVTVCPECEGEVHRVIGPVGIVFKGAGFYANDSRKNKHKAEA
ncbi:MAG: FmdB family transcriptional regulator [Chloroflexi bacterium]|nr:FmdB family transcriptional regulator [Chloroflexota bacterium]